MTFNHFMTMELSTTKSLVDFMKTKASNPFTTYRDTGLDDHRGCLKEAFTIFSLGAFISEAFYLKVNSFSHLPMV